LRAGLNVQSGESKFDPPKVGGALRALPLKYLQDGSEIATGRNCTTHHYFLTTVYNYQ
jgi:hypothetical protein